MTAQYTLERTLPDGQVKTQGPTTRRQACGLAAHVIADNCGTTDRAALAVARQLNDSPDGATVESHGYTFRLRPTRPVLRDVPRLPATRELSAGDAND
jgi:hypothetical protein